VLHVTLSRVRAIEGDAAWRSVGVIPDWRLSVSVRADKTPRISGAGWSCTRMKMGDGVRVAAVCRSWGVAP
jgi:hypothetical protein